MIDIAYISVCDGLLSFEHVEDKTTVDGFIKPMATYMKTTAIGINRDNEDAGIKSHLNDDHCMQYKVKAETAFLNYLSYYSYSLNPMLSQ